MLIEEYSLLDAFYMTVITITTIGYGEVHPLSEMGRIFTIGLILTSFGTFAFAVTALSNYMLSGEYRKSANAKQKRKMLKSLDNHVIVCGYGRVGKQAVRTLRAYEKKVVVIERSETESEDKEIIFLTGDATDDEMLEQAGIKNASSIITTLPSDSDNLFVVITARSLNHHLEIICRASDPRSLNKIKTAGAHRVIMPDMVGGQHMAQLVVHPDLMEFLDRISEQTPYNVNLEEVSFNELPPELRNKSIRELNETRLTGCTIIGFKDHKGQFYINPDDSIAVVPNSKLFVLGTKEQIKKLNFLLKSE